MSAFVPATEATALARRSSRLATCAVGLMVCLGLSASAGLGFAQPGDPAPAAKGKVPDALPASGKETFVDLPARGENLPGVAGVNFGATADKPTPTKPKPRGKPKSAGKFVDPPLPAQPPDGWQEYVQEKYKYYSVWLPKTGRKLLQREGVLDLKTLKVGYAVLRCEIDDDITVNIRRLIIPLAKGETLDPITMIELFRDLYLEDEDVEGTVTKEYDLMLGQMQGKEYRVDLKSGEKSRVRIYQIGRAVWQVWVTGTKEQVEGESAKLVFGSFKNQLLLKKDQPAKKP